MRPMSRTYTSLPPCAVWSFTTMPANWPGSSSRDWISTLYWNCTSAGAGGMPIWPAATFWLCWRTASITSFGVRPKENSFCGSIQIRIE